MPSRFAADTSVTALGGGAFAARMDRGWWIERGPNGGYVAAVVLRALGEAVGDPNRTPRSLTVHYQAPPAEGEVRIDTTVERAGRLLSFVSARLTQGDRLLATAQGAFAIPMAGPEFVDIAMPAVPPPEDVPRTPAAMASGGPVIPMRERYEMRWCVGAPPFSGAPEALAGGWIRLADPHPADHPLLAALTDAWMPPIFSRTQQRLAVPTIDLTVHFRAPLPAAQVDPDGWFLVVFRSQLAADGFVEEDGEVWSRGGTLLAHSRQLAVLLPIPSEA